VSDNEPRDRLTMPNKQGSTLKPVTINLRGDGSDRVPRGADLPHSSAKCFGLKDAHRSANSPPAKILSRSYYSREVTPGDVRCSNRGGPETQP
jgi:hypothetical protein